MSEDHVALLHADLAAMAEAIGVIGGLAEAMVGDDRILLEQLVSHLCRATDALLRRC